MMFGFFAEDEVYCKLEDCLCALGRGWSPKLPKNINITKKTTANEFTEIKLQKKMGICTRMCEISPWYPRYKIRHFVEKRKTIFLMTELNIFWLKKFHFYLLALAVMPVEFGKQILYKWMALMKI